MRKWLTYTTEELGELAEAISEHIYRDGNREHIIKEAIQTATLCLKIAEMVETGSFEELKDINNKPEWHLKLEKEVNRVLTDEEAYNLREYGTTSKEAIAQAELDDPHN